MPAKRAATKKQKAGSKKKVATKAAGKSAGRRSASTSKRQTPRRPSSKKTSSKKTVKSAKSTSRKKVTKKQVAAPKGQPKASGKKIAGSARAVAPAAPATKRRGGGVLSGPVRGFTPYQPRRGEDYMSKGQLEHFRQILLAWKRELMEEVDRTMLHMKDDAANFPDPNDRATQESEFGLELRTRDRERKLLKKIDSALARIDDGSYGYCEETGDEIGLRRLEARPVATLCVEAQERRELAERQFRDREDQYR